MKEHNERSLQSSGYTYDSIIKGWHKVIDDEIAIGVPSIGTGKYRKLHCVGGDFTTSRMSEIFHMPNLIMARNIEPYPFDSFTSVKIRKFGEEAERSFMECDFSLNENYLSIATIGIFRASYSKDGKIEELNVSFGDGGFASFRLLDEKIFDSEGNYLGKLQDYLNTNKKLYFDEHHYVISQSNIEIKVEVIRPVSGQKVVDLSLPPKISMKNLRKILTREDKDWLELVEHIPARLELPQGFPQ